MKKFVLLTVAFTAFVMVGFAQKYMVVDSQKIFQSLPDYKAAIAEIDTLSARYQRNIDAAYQQVEQMYNEYQSQKASMSESTRESRQDVIIDNEKKINKYQEETFGQNGTLMQKRIEIIKPIQDRVFGIVNKYAEANGFDLVIDIASNPTILYYTPSADKTEQIINQLK